MQLLEHAMKLVERVLERIRELVNIDKVQFGFVPGRETTDALELLSIQYKASLRPLLTYALPGGFPFLSVSNITKLETPSPTGYSRHLGCLSFSCNPFLFEASLAPYESP